jgi:diguanylate cyclase (GGDEF)-like protein
MSGMRFKAANGARPEEWLRKLLRSLDFRIVVPIVLMMSLLGVGAYAVMLKTIASFADERIYEDLKRSSTDVYGICDAALQRLLTAGLAGREPATRLRQGEALGEIEQYVQQSPGLSAVVFSDEGGEILLNTQPALGEAALISATRKEGAVVPLEIGAKVFYARRSQFDLWKWHFVLIKDGKSYAGLVAEVNRTYISTGIALLGVSLLLVFHLRRVIQIPIRSIIASVQTDGAPQYRGTYEFEFLSDKLREAALRQQAEQAKITHQATHDALTGLINRSEFERRLDQALQAVQGTNERHTVLYLDLDQFKIVNDTSGHAAGDELLRQLTAVLLGRLRKNDTLARLGGDEFGVLLNECPSESAVLVAESLRQLVCDFRFSWLDRTFPIGASIGLVSFGDEGLTLAEVLRLADAACYVAKDSGRNRVHVYHAGDKELALRDGEMDWIGRIHKALDDDRFVLYMQRIVALQADGIAGGGEYYELLIRMVDERGQLVPPMAFIPAAERYGLMLALDRWVIRNALAQLASAPAALESLRHCGINLSGSSLGDSSLFAFISEQLATFGVPPSVICFEITETLAIANLSKAAELIRELKAIGCRFALDDFGSGMSSFTYLKTLGVDFLKIDGSFVKDMMNDPIDHAMVEAINNIGHVVGIRTIAEFVEDDAIRRELTRIGVDFGQGYGVAKPCPFAGHATADAGPLSPAAEGAAAIPAAALAWSD